MSEILYLGPDDPNSPLMIGDLVITRRGLFVLILGRLGRDEDVFEPTIGWVTLSEITGEGERIVR